MFRPRSPKPVVQKLGLLTESHVVVGLAGSNGYNCGAGTNAELFKYPFATRFLRSPLESPLAIDAPGARLAPSNGVLPCPRNPVPAPESKIENGVPVWKMV